MATGAQDDPVLLEGDCHRDRVGKLETAGPGLFFDGGDGGGVAVEKEASKLGVESFQCRLFFLVQTGDSSAQLPRSEFDRKV